MKYLKVLTKVAWGFMLTPTLLVFSALREETECARRKYGDSTKLEGGTDAPNRKDLIQKECEGF